MSAPTTRLLSGERRVFETAWERFSQQPVDWDLTAGPHVDSYSARSCTIREPFEIAGPGTFFGKEVRKLRVEPYDQDGWWFLRDDLPEALPVKASVRNVWTTGAVVSNIVLRSGPPQNYIRMVEHIIAMRLGMGIDRLLIRVESGDPPLFDRGSLDFVEGLEKAGRAENHEPARYVTVKEPVSIVGTNGEFLVFEPAVPGDHRLHIDCAIKFPTAIGQQRIRFPLTHDLFKQGSVARTNTSFFKMFYCKLIGWLFADIRNLGYTRKNILIASRFGYVNEARLKHDGKSLEAVWHRAVLDLLAAIALIEEGRFAGRVTSYCAGHRLDCQFIGLLYKHGLLTPIS